MITMLVPLIAACNGDATLPTNLRGVEAETDGRQSLRAPGTIERFNRKGQLIVPVSSGSEANPPVVAAAALAPRSIDSLTPAEFASLMNSPMVKRSPEIGRILTAARTHASPVEFMEVMRSLPLTKSVELLSNSTGAQVVTTYHYKGRKLLKTHRQEIIQLGTRRTLPPTSPSGSATPWRVLPATYLSRASELAVEDDTTLASLEQLEALMAHVDAVGYEMELLQEQEAIAWAEYEASFNVAERAPDASTDPRPIAPVKVLNCSSPLSPAGAFELPCWAKHTVATVGLLTSFAAYEPIRAEASAAWVARATAQAVTTTVVRAAFLYTAAAGAFVVAGIAVYEAVQCSRGGGGTEVDWTPPASTFGPRRQNASQASRVLSSA